MSNEIDFVVPWVDGSDPEWQRRKAMVTGTVYSDDSMQRYREWDLLRYWFRGVEKFAPWVHRVWFICDQEPPKWLNRAHSKLTIVRHEDYIPDDYRPAFSSHPIELNMHRIKGLAEQFVYFNDDMYLIAPVDEQFFFKDGLPRDSALLNPIPTTDLLESGRNGKIFTIDLNNINYLNCDYDFRTCTRKHLRKWLHPCYGKNVLRNLMLLTWPRFVGIIEDHLPQAFLKSSFDAAWEQDYDILDRTSRRHIRNEHDVNQWLIRQRQLAEGKFIPRKPHNHDVFNIDQDDPRMHQIIRDQRRKMICIGDSGVFDENRVAELKAKVQADFESILGEKSAFELY